MKPVQERFSTMYEMRKQGKTYTEIGEVFGLHKSTIRDAFSTVDYKKYVSEFEKNTFGDDLEKNGFEGDNWSHGWLKSDTSSIFIRNNKEVVKYEDIRDGIIEEMKKYSPKYPTIKRNITKEKHLLIIDPADLHVGKLSMEDETGNDYNIDIAEKRCIDAVQAIIDKAVGFGIEKILLVIGNDIIHIDHPNRHTTANTPQDTDKQWWYMFQRAKKLYITLIETLMQYADVDIVYNPSNHDYMSGYYLSDTVMSWFSKSKNVTFDTGIKHRKYYTYGKNLIGTTHGDGAKEQDLVYLMAHESKEWSTSEYRYWYLHHIHHHKKIKYQSGKDYIGCTLEYLRSPSEADAWHDRNGYVGAKKAIEAFIHHPTQGQVAKITHNF